MYSEWTSLEQELQKQFTNRSILCRFPPEVGSNVACVVVHNLAENLRIGGAALSSASNSSSNLKNDKEVHWTMEVLSYALTLPLTEMETIRDCVNLYCEWLTALTPTPRQCVPQPVVDDPNPYIQLMLQHLYRLFVPRPGSSTDQVTRQVLLCHRVLRTIQSATAESGEMTRDTWSHLLKFLLAINDALLGPPTEKDGIGDQLCERVLSVLFEMWLAACAKCFPSPPLWKTFRNMASQWRHHQALITQWHRITTLLTAQMLKMLYGPEFPTLFVAEEDGNLLSTTADNDCLAQAWFRFLHILGNPVDLCHPAIISQTPKFMHQALTSEKHMEAHQHPCLWELPGIFHQAMKCISVLVDSFLGMCYPGGDPELAVLAISSTRHSVPPAHLPTTPPTTRKAKTVTGVGKVATKMAPSAMKSTAGAASTPTSSPAHRTLESRPPLASSRPTVNSILHLFGAWLVEGSLTGVQVQGSSTKVLLRRRTASFHVGSDLAGHLHSTPLADESEVKLNRYESGRAEACGALCRIFCSHKTGEEILPVYLARFYISVYYGLKTDSNLSGIVLSNIIFNSCDLLRIDLDGVQVLVPEILTALEFILHDLTPKFECGPLIPTVELRKTSIHLLLSMLCLPLHYKSLNIHSLFPDGRPHEGDLQFQSLKVPIIELLLRALTVETDSTNTQMLLGGLLLCVEDLAHCEEAEQTMSQEVQDPGCPPSPTVASNAGSDSNPKLSVIRSPSTTEFDSAHGLFGHATSLVCNRLMASWKMELNIALAALEVLGGLAKVSLNRPNLLMCKRTVNWICEFIVYQCSRPAPAHSRDLHSMIVAAFQCLAGWLVQHDLLLQDKECLQAVLEVVELGISGAKSQFECEEEYHQPPPSTSSSSHKHKAEKELLKDYSKLEREIYFYPSEQNRASDIPKLKGNKELKPVSLRVKDAAEALLTIIMDHVGSFPPPSGPESVYSLLDEEALLKYNKDGSLTDTGSPFRYFVLDGTIILGLLEQPLGNDQDPLPTVTAIVRGPFGRHAWTSQLRHVPRIKQSPIKASQQTPSRPEPDDDVGIHHNVKQRYFPSIVDEITPVKSDQSIPPLSSTMQKDSEDLDILTGFIKDQVAFEERIAQTHKEERVNYPNPETECVPPDICEEFQTARLFLSHYGFLSLESLREPSGSGLPPSLVQLESSETGFFMDLLQLDSMPCRISDTVHIFYVKSGQKMPFEILSNVTSKQNVDVIFLEVLRSLGWPVDVKKHAGWTGHVSNSYKIQHTDELEECYPGDTGGSLYDGRQQILYWADVLSEIAFVVPSPETYQPALRRYSVDSTSTTSTISDKSPGLARAETTIRPRPLDMMKPKSLSLDLDNPPPPQVRDFRTPTDGTPNVRMRKFKVNTTGNIPEAKIFMVWLESYEDHENFPADELLGSTNTGLESQQSSVNSLSRASDTNLYVIYIHALHSGLFRVHMQVPASRVNVAVPLVDGMVVSRRVLGVLIRQTAINICRRKRLENEGYQPPHVRRKNKVKEIVDKYRNQLSEPEFYTSLFQEAFKS